ncbi:MAG: MMPL family transporter [Nitrospinota bacterium]|nr:MMPL family transporter [Nitrospinota bacterium]
MHLYRKAIENWFEQLTKLVYKKRLTTIFLILALVGAIASNLPNLKIDTETEGFLHENDPTRKVYNEFRDQFGRDELIVLALHPKDVFDITFLSKLQTLHKELEDSVPHLDDVTSLINARNTRGEGDQLIVEDLLENFPQSQNDITELRERVLSNPLYRNTMISEDGKFTTLIIKTSAFAPSDNTGDMLGGFEDTKTPEIGTAPKRKFLSAEDNRETVNKVKEIIAKYKSPDFPILIAGSPVMTNDLKAAMMKDMQKFMKLLVVIIAISLYALFRRKTGVLIPLIIVILSLLSTLGLMALFGAAIKLPTQILPSFLLAVGVGASVHVLALFFKEFDHGKSEEEAVVFAMGHSGIPIFMTSLTTAVGLASFATAEVAPIADLGLFAGIGVMFSLLYTIVLIPALISILPVSRKSTENEIERHAFMDGILRKTADFATGNAKAILSVSGVIIVLSLISASGIRFSHNPMAWFPKTWEIRKATTEIDTNMRGTTSLEVILDTGKENGLHDVEFLNKLQNMEDRFSKLDRGELFVGKVITLVDMLKEINKALNENRSDFYKVPQDRQLIAQELLLFENSGSDDLEDIVDSQFSKVRFTMKLPWIDSVAYSRFIKEVEAEFENEFKGLATVEVTGLATLLGRTLGAAVTSAGKSYLIAFAMITIMMILLVGDIRIGLYSMIPNLFPIVVALGIMIPFGMPLDLFTMLIGSIALGLAVDDTVHFMHNFRKYYHEKEDVSDAVRRSLHTAGRAMLVTTIVLSTGFFIFMFASMNNLFNFGFLTGLTIIMALVADFLIAPALMKVIDKPGAGYDN